MRLALLAPTQWSGLWGRWTEVAVQLAKRSHEVYFVEHQIGGGEDAPGQVADPRRVPDGVYLVSPEPSSCSYVGSKCRDFANVVSVVKSLSPCIVVAYNPVFDLGVALRSRCGSSARLVLDYVDDIAEFEPVASKRFCIRHVFTPLMARLADHCICTAEMLARDLRRYSRRVSVIPNGVDLDAFPMAARSDKAARSGAVAFVGVFGEWVDFDAVLDAARQLPDVAFDMYGGGPQFEDVKRRARDSANVRLHGMIPRSEVADAIDGASACIIPFKINRLTDRVFPLKLAEYWAMRKPVICSPFAEVKLVAGDRVLFASDGAELAAQIQRLCDDPGLAEQLGEEGYREVVEKYDAAKLMERYEEVLLSLLPSRRR